MASNFDAEEFIDEDYRGSGGVPGGVPGGGTDPQRAPTREEVESRVGEMQSKLAELKRAQQELERQRATLEELRRRQAEFSTGRQEMVHHLVRGIGLLEEADLVARRQAEQLSTTLNDFREALGKVQSIQEETWTKDTLEVELTRASTIVENARMEWNAALVKLPILSGETPQPALVGESVDPNEVPSLFRPRSYAELCKMGLALTWPVALIGLAIFLVLMMR